MVKTANWFDVDRAGLRQLVAGRGPEFIVYELLQNAFDEKVTRVDVSVTPIEGTRHWRIEVIDDSPDGFRDLRDAYTLYAPSYKKDHAEKRGRFNLGEKLVLALAYQAEIESTTGTVGFDANGRHTYPRRRRASGTAFRAALALTGDDVCAIEHGLQRVIAPAGVTVWVSITTRVGNTRLWKLAQREPLRTFTIELPTVVSDAEGVLRPTRRQAEVRLYEPNEGTEATICELGIPVVALPGDRYHVDVQQKVPLNADRDNVTPAYLQALRVAVLNATHDLLTKQDARATWVTAASEDERAVPAAVEKVVTSRFGEKRVVFDPSDPEANNRAVAEGYTIIPGGSLTSGQWGNLRRDQHALPAGKVFPTPKVGVSPDGIPAIEPRDDREKLLVGYVTQVARALLGKSVHVLLYSSRKLTFAGAYGYGELSLNLASMGRAWHNFPTDVEPLLSLLLHECAHDRESNHLSEGYYRACTDLGARLAVLAATGEVPVKAADIREQQS